MELAAPASVEGERTSRLSGVAVKRAFSASAVKLAELGKTIGCLLRVASNRRGGKNLGTEIGTRRGPQIGGGSAAGAG